MASAGEIRAGRAFIEIGEKGLAATQTKLKNLGTTFKSVGGSISETGASIMKWSTAALAPLGASIRTYGEMGKELIDLSNRSGMSVEALGGLGYAAEHCGMDMESMVGSVDKLEKLVYEASQGSKEAADKFDMLGMSWEKMVGITPDQQLEMVADRLSKIQNPTQQAGIAMDLFGKSGTKMLGMLKNGSKGLEQFKQAATDLGYVMSGEDAKAAEEFNNSMGDMWRSIKMTAFHIGAALAPALKPLLKDFLEGAKKAMDWVRENQGLIISFGKIALIALGVGAGLFAIGKAVTSIGWAFGRLSSVVGIAKSLFSGVANVFLWFVTNPIALIIAGVVSLVAYFSFMCSQVGDSTTTLSDLWNNMKDDFNEAFGTIIESLKSGNLAAAMGIAWALLKLEWVRGLGFLTEKWYAFKDGFCSIWTEAVFMIARIFTASWWGILTTSNYVWFGIRKGILGVTTFFQSMWAGVVYWFSWAWSGVVNWFKGIWSAASNFVSKGWIWLKEKLGITDKKTSDAQRKAIDDKAAEENKARENAKDADDKARDEAYYKKMADIEAANKAESDGINDDLKKRQDAIDEDNKNRKDALKSQQEEENRQRELKAKKGIDDAKAGVEAAKKAFDEANQEVHKENVKRQEKHKKEAGAGKDGKPPALGFETMKQQASVTGTFSAWAVRGIGQTKVENLLTRIEKNTRFKIEGFDTTNVGA